jgi:hypothetical protein
MKYPAQKVAIREYNEAVHECTGRATRLSEQIGLALEEWRMAAMVKALQALRGISLINNSVRMFHFWGGEKCLELLIFTNNKLEQYAIQY